MKKIFLILMLYMQFICMVNSQNVQWSWTFSSEGSGKDRGLKIALDGDYNLYASGYFSDTLVFEDDTLIASGPQDSYVIKVDSSGNYKWSFQIEGSGTIRDIDASVNGELYIVGLYNDSLFLFGDTLIGGLGYIAKFDSSGNYLWDENVLSTSNYVLLNTIEVDDSNNIYISGDFYEDLSFDTLSIDPGTAMYENNMFVVKFNDSGSGIWVRSALVDCGGMSGGMVDMVTDANGNIYVLSVVTCSVDFGNGVSYIHTALMDGNVLVKYNSDGLAQWCEASSNDMGISQSMDLSYDNGYGIYYTGYAFGGVTFGGIPFPIDFSLSIEGFYAKYDTSGNFLWAKSFGSISSADDIGADIEFDINGNGYLIGMFGDTMVVSGDTLIGVDLSPTMIADNLFFAKLDSAGNMLEVKKADLTIDDNFFGDIMLSDYGVLYLAGYEINSSKKSGTKSSTSNLFLGKQGIPTPDPIVLTPFTTSVNCYGECNGSIIMNISGGTPPFLFEWNNSATNDTINNLCAGTYCLTVTDDISDTASLCVSVAEPDQILLSLSSTDDSGTGDGTATVTPIGGVNPYTYNWSSGSTDSIATYLTFGTYMITVTDANGCYLIDSVNVNLLESVNENYGENNLQIFPNPSNRKIYVLADEIVKIEIIDLQGKYIYSGKESEIDISQISNGIYTIKVTLNNGVVNRKIIKK